MRRVCGAAAQPALRTGSARCTCESVGSGALGRGWGRLWVKGMDAEGFVFKRALSDGWEYLWNWSKVGKPIFPSKPSAGDSHLTASLEKMKPPGKDLAPLKQSG